MTAWRMFVASPTEVTCTEVNAALDKAIDVLQAAGVLHEKSLRLLMACEQRGEDPVAFAHHFVGLASAVQDREAP